MNDVLIAPRTAIELAAMFVPRDMLPKSSTAVLKRSIDGTFAPYVKTAAARNARRMYDPSDVISWCGSKLPARVWEAIGAAGLHRVDVPLLKEVTGEKE